MERMRPIVVGIDFSDGSIRALEFATEHARTVGANVVCVHAYEDAPETPPFHDPAQAFREQLNEVIALRRPPWSSLRVDPIVSLSKRGPTTSAASRCDEHSPRCSVGRAVRVLRSHGTCRSIAWERY